MHKTFYASGFLYHLSSQQILLQRPSTNTLASSWSLFETEYKEEEEAESTFKNALAKHLDIQIDIVYPIYFYLYEPTQKNYSLMYVPVKKLQEFPEKNGHVFQWFSFKEIVKLPIPEQIKHDIVVGQRVIEAAGRKLRGEHTL